MTPRVEVKKPGSQAGRLAQGTSPHRPHTCHHPAHRVLLLTLHAPRDGLLAHTHTHTHTYTHTHSTRHTPKGIRGPNPGKKFFTSVRKFVSTGRTGQSRKKPKQTRGYLLIHPSSHLVRRFGEALRQGLRFWLPQTHPL